MKKLVACVVALAFCLAIGNLPECVADSVQVDPQALSRIQFPIPERPNLQENLYAEKESSPTSSLLIMLLKLVSHWIFFKGILYSYKF